MWAAVLHWVPMALELALLAGAAGAGAGHAGLSTLAGPWPCMMRRAGSRCYEGTVVCGAVGLTPRSAMR
eukprot:SAG31_NODE_348_length_17296_cov_5.089482_16_plen_69_part_00